ncbi:g13554 [Coccomyxa viridis]|uniref:G13554 protein n=1 Tax=Coccomyxa viridis TaxID=1274662 RepID=A0ABP1GH75_9CHLO
MDSTAEDRTDEAYGKVMSAQANFVSVSLDENWAQQRGGKAEILCTVRGILKKIKQTVLVGDRVRVAGIDWEDMRATVDEVLPRATELQDPAVANVDQVLLVFAMERPALDLKGATRFLVSTEAAELPVAVILNKADLVPQQQCDEAVREIEAWGYQTIPVSAASGRGLDQLNAVLKDKVSVVAGPSGVGKSSIINALKLQRAAADGAAARSSALAAAIEADSSSLSGLSNGPKVDPGSADDNANSRSNAEESMLDPLKQWREMQDDAESLGLQRIGPLTNNMRGKHTTRHVSLLEVAGGLLADSPGFNQPSLDRLTPGNLPDCFPEIRNKSEECAFRNCQHLEEPGCAVREGWSRHEWYAELHEEVKAADEVARHRAASKKRREGSVRYKSGAGGQKTREALLDPKSHRRVSRRQVRQGIQDLIQEAEESDQL